MGVRIPFDPALRKQGNKFRLCFPSDSRNNPLRKQNMHAAAVSDSRVIIEVKQQTADGGRVP